MTLQTILLPDPDICDVSDLYYHQKEDLIEFDGYFNLFYIEKRQKYTALQDLFLVLTLKGYRVLLLMHDRDVIAEHELDENTAKEYRFSLPISDYDSGVFWFALIPGEFDIPAKDTVRGSYDGIPVTDRNVNIALTICTFKREAYLYRNLIQLSRFMGYGDNNTAFSSEVASHLYVHIVDNGQTLQDHDDIQSLLNASDGHIRVIPNANTGGAGGFSRGMQEALNKEKELGLTHILLMDDDAVFDPDVFVRLYGMLRTIRPEYESYTLGGSYLREDYQYIQQAAGEWYQNFHILNKKPMLDLRSFDNCTDDYMCTTSNEKRLYSGWWCACFPMSDLHEEPLPLPLFIHHDDIQFGMHTTLNHGIIFMNGINIWHKGDMMQFTGSNMYYDIRNALITNAMFYPEITVSEVRQWVRSITYWELFFYRYAEIDLLYKGVSDYLRGPKWLLNSDPERINGKLREFYNSRISFVSSKELVAQGIATQAAFDRAKKRFRKSLFTRPQPTRSEINHKKRSLNGWLLPSKKTIPVMVPPDHSWMLYRYREAVLYEPDNDKAAHVYRDYRKIFRALCNMLRMMVRITRHYSRATAAYRNWYEEEKQRV